MGAERNVRLRSKGIPIGVTPAKARAILDRGFIRQEVTQQSINDLAVVRACLLIYNRKYGSPADVESWTDFFENHVPKEPLNRTNCHPRKSSYLHKLFEEYGGEARRKDRNYLIRRPTISDFSESMVYPSAPWTQSERDASAQFAVSTNPTLQYTKNDLRKVVVRKKKNKDQQIEENGEKKAIGKRAVKERNKSVTIKEAQATTDKGSKKLNKAKRRRKVVDVDEESVDTQSTGASSFTYSLKSKDDSDLDSGFPSTAADDSSIGSNFSTTDVAMDVLPKRMKHREVAESFYAKVGKRFKDAENNVIYRVLSVCRHDEPIERGSILVDQLCFRYIVDDLEISDIDDIDDIESSLCCEMMADNSWAQWLD